MAASRLAIYFSLFISYTLENEISPAPHLSGQLAHCANLAGTLLLVLQQMISLHLSALFLFAFPLTVSSLLKSQFLALSKHTLGSPDLNWYVKSPHSARKLFSTQYPALLAQTLSPLPSLVLLI